MLTIALVSVILAQTQLQGPVVSPKRYELDVTVDYEAERLRGMARITVENIGGAPAVEIPLTLYRLMTVSSVEADDGAPLGFVQDVVQDRGFEKQQVNEIRVTLPAPLPPRGRTTLRIAYGGYLLGYAETGMAYVRDRINPAFTILRDDAHAFPLVGAASSSARRTVPMASYEYVARITVPDTLVVANGGRLVERTQAGALATYTYRSILPSWRMDFAIGKYAEKQVGPVRLVYLQRDSAGAARVANVIAAALELFTGWFGAPPGTPALTILEIEDGFGSQTDVTTILQAAGPFRDSTRNNEIYHEVSHLWNAPDSDRPSPRWNEGLASFLEHLAVQKLEGGDVDTRMNAWMKWLRGKAEQDSALRETPLIDYGKEEMTGWSYTVGALFFHQLYRKVGEQDFNRIIGGYGRTYERGGGSTAALMKFAQASTRADLSPLFRDWLTTAGWYAVIRNAESVQDITAHYR